jgi:RimJ/RimL family protein N-acetyltransferase
VAPAVPAPAVDPAFVTARTTHVHLRDGTEVVLRPIVPEDKELLVAAFERLSPESRYRRFFTPVTELKPAILEFLTEIDYVNHFAWAAMATENGEEVGVGVARYVRLEDPQAAEAAITVIDPYQGRGLGSLLLEALALEALEQGVRRLEGEVLEENEGMQSVLRRAGARFRAEGAGVLRFEVDLPDKAEELPSSPLSEVLRAVARGEAALYERENCPWLAGWV